MRAPTAYIKIVQHTNGFIAFHRTTSPAESGFSRTTKIFERKPDKCLKRTKAWKTWRWLYRDKRGDSSEYSGWIPEGDDAVHGADRFGMR